MIELIHTGSSSGAVIILAGVLYLSFGWVIPSMFAEPKQKILARNPVTAAKIARIRALDKHSGR